MSTYFQSVNDIGTTQIDDEHRTQTLSRSGKIRANINSGELYCFQLADDEFFAAFRVINGNLVISPITICKGKRTYYVGSEGDIDIYYYTFSTQVAKPSEHLTGLEVYDKDGNVVYTSSKPTGGLFSVRGWDEGSRLANTEGTWDGKNAVLFDALYAGTNDYTERYLAKTSGAAAWEVENTYAIGLNIFTSIWLPELWCLLGIAAGETEGRQRKDVAEYPPQFNASMHVHTYEQHPKYIFTSVFSFSTSGGKYKISASEKPIKHTFYKLVNSQSKDFMIYGYCDSKRENWHTQLCRLDKTNLASVYGYSGDRCMYSNTGLSSISYNYNVISLEGCD